MTPADAERNRPDDVLPTGPAGSDAPDRSPGAHRSGGRRRRRGRSDDVMVPDAEFGSYYGHPIVKPAPWDHKIPAYLYLGGLAAGSALLAAGADLTGRPALRRNARFTAVGALGGSMYALIADLGKPSRFLNMLRVVKVTSPMSLGTWILSVYGAFTGGAMAAEVAQLLLPDDHIVTKAARLADRPLSLSSAAFSPLLGAYTAVLLSDTATPTWHAAHRELPFVFVGSGMLAAGGAAMVTTPVSQAGPARVAALVGGALEFASHHRMVDRLGLLAEPLHEGRAGRYGRLSQALGLGGLAVTALFGRCRPAAVLAGLALNASSALVRFSVFEAGIASAKDPKYTVVPQRERLEARRAAGRDAHGITTA